MKVNSIRGKTPPQAPPFFATCPKGLEELLEDELLELGAVKTKKTVAGVHFSGPLQLAYKACLWSRLASRILFTLGDFWVRDADDLYHAARKINWSAHMTVDTTFMINFTGTNQDITHTQFAAQKIKDAIVDQFRLKTGQRPSVDTFNPMLRIHGLLQKGKVFLSLDFSGDSLHRRGYRLEGGVAPLKENLAAAILKRAKWLEIAKKGGSLVDPMCGSGTLLIEGVLMAADIAPNLMRPIFGFHGWKQHSEELWQGLVTEAKERAKKGKLGLLSTFYGFDIDAECIALAQANVRRSGLQNYIKLFCADITHLSSAQIRKTYGLCICNPPYGERLEEGNDLLPLYRTLSRKLKEHFLNWEAGIFTGNPTITKNMGLRAYKKYAMFNGKIPCQLLLFHLTPKWFIATI